MLAPSGNDPNQFVLKGGRFVAALLAIAALLIVGHSLKATTKDSPVIVEMFESQGCSSCPPAERVLSDLKKKFGDSIVALNYHVDYWDQGGWVDSFSNHRYTQRQQEYSAVFHQDQLYTPQMVIQGEIGFLGSSARDAEKAINSRLIIERPRFELKQTPGAWSGKLDVTFSTPPELAEKIETITIVIFENRPPVRVARGENAGKTMSGESAVRRIEIEPVNKTGAYRIQLPLEAGTVRSKAGVAVLLQGESHEIVAAESIYPLEGSDAT